MCYSFSPPPFSLTGCSRTPRRPRSPGSKSKEFTPGDASCGHSVRVCHALSLALTAADALAFLHLQGDVPTAPACSLSPFLPSQHSRRLTQSSVHRLSDPNRRIFALFFFFYLPSLLLALSCGSRTPPLPRLTPPPTQGLGAP